MDLLVLPSTEGLAPDKLERIRALYNAGVFLLAVSHVDGLEDLLGVELAPETQKSYTVLVNVETEAIYPYEETAFWSACTATNPHGYQLNN